MDSTSWKEVWLSNTILMEPFMMMILSSLSSFVDAGRDTNDISFLLDWMSLTWSHNNCLILCWYLKYVEELKPLTLQNSLTERGLSLHSLILKYQNLYFSFWLNSWTVIYTLFLPIEFMKQYKNYNTVYGLLHILYYSFCTRIFLSTILFCGYEPAKLTLCFLI